MGSNFKGKHLLLRPGILSFESLFPFRSWKELNQNGRVASPGSVSFNPTWKLLICICTHFCKYVVFLYTLITENSSLMYSI